MTRDIYQKATVQKVNFRPTFHERPPRGTAPDRHGEQGARDESLAACARRASPQGNPDLPRRAHPTPRQRLGKSQKHRGSRTGLCATLGRSTLGPRPPRRTRRPRGRWKPRRRGQPRGGLGTGRARTLVIFPPLKLAKRLRDSVRTLDVRWMVKRLLAGTFFLHLGGGEWERRQLLLRGSVPHRLPSRAASNGVSCNAICGPCIPSSHVCTSEAEGSYHRETTRAGDSRAKTKFFPSEETGMREKHL